MNRSAPVVLIVVALSLVVPAGTQLSRAGAPAEIHTSQLPIVTGNLSVGPEPIANLSSMFWGSTISTRARLLSDEAELINSTGVRTFVFPGGNSGDRYNPFNNSELGIIKTHVDRKAVWINGWTTVGTNESQFIQFCRAVNCTAIFQVPGEIDNASFAAKVVHYTVDTLGFSPAYWEIGNEPGLWKNWGQSWGNWTSDGPTVTPEEYAQEVGRYVVAMRAVDPNIRIIGIAGTGAPNGAWPLTTWVADLLYDDGPEINAVAYHEYPAGHTANESLLSFYSALQTNSSVPFHVDQLREEISNITALANYTAVCPNVTPGPVCGPIPVLATEIGSGLSNKWTGAYAKSFPGGVSLAAQMIQAMTLNLSNVDLFGTELGVANSWFNTSGQARPDFTVYSSLLSHLGSEVFPVSFSLPSADYANNTSSLAYDLYGIATVAQPDDSRADLLLVNDNLSTGVGLAPTLPGVPPGSPAELWTWSGSPVYNGTNYTLPYVAEDSQAPVAEFFPAGVPAGWVLQPETIALVESYPVPAAPVTFSATGLPNGSSWWFVDAGGFRAATDAEDLTLLLPDGSYGATTPQVYAYTYAGEGANQWSRISSRSSIGFTINGQPAVVSIALQLQWRITVDAVPSVGGHVYASGTWANAGEPFSLSAASTPGWIFNRWFGWGTGNETNSTSSSLTIPDVTGHIDENATFVPAYNVSFLETGLPLGANWSVSLDGHLTSNTTRKTTAQQVLTFQAANGTWGFNVTPPIGYTSRPLNGSVNVTGSAVSVTIAFGPGRPPPPDYEVELREAGLPGGTDWAVSVRGGAPDPSNGASSIVLYEPNGTYGFTVNYVPGYHPDPLRDAFSVAGSQSSAPLITFLQNRTPGPTLYPVVWEETGLGPAPNWTVDVSGLGTVQSNGSWVSDRLPNGTYSYTIPGTGTAAPTVDEGTVDVQGSGHTVAVAFQVGRTVIVPDTPTWTALDTEALMVSGIIFGGIVLMGAVVWSAGIVRLKRRGCPDPPNHHLHTARERCVARSDRDQPRVGNS
jgi:hypothetical protein